MPITLNPIESGAAIEVTVSDKLHKEDYEVFVPQLEQAIEENGKVRLVFNMHDFHGWDTAALWSDLKFDIKHFKDIKRVAMVGERKWEQAMAAFCKPFTTGKVKYFDQDKISDARQWVLEDD